MELPEILENDLLVLKPLKEKDFNELYQIASDPLIWEQHPAKNRYEREVFEIFFAEAIKGGYSFKVLDKSTNQIIGSTRFYNYRKNESSVAIGYTFLARKYWGGKYNKSMKDLLMNFAFQFVDNVYFHVGENNIRSQMALNKIGAKRVGILQNEINSKVVISYEYLIRKKDYI